MTVNSLTPDLMVEDLGATVEWYQRVFDAEVVATLPSDDDGDDYFWAQVMVNESPLMLQERESLEEKLPVLEREAVGGSVALYLDVDDAAGLYEDLESEGVDIISAPQETEFGWRQFAVTDPNGYVLWFGEKLETERAEDIGRRHRTYQDHLTHEGTGPGTESHYASPRGGREHWG